MQFSILLIAVALARCSLAAPAADQSAYSDPLKRELMKRVDCEYGCKCTIEAASHIVASVIDSGTSVMEVSDEDWATLYAHRGCALDGIAGSGQTSSYGQDVGYGAKAILDTCGSGSGVQGFNTAGGNGNFIIRLYDYQAC